MATVRKAPLMQIRRRDDDDETRSYATTETIPATLAALREYMVQHPLGKAFSEQELASVKFRHRSPDRTDDEKLHGPIKDWWSAPWVIVYVKDIDRKEGDETARKTFRKPHYYKTVYGYCTQYPVS